MFQLGYDVLEFFEIVQDGHVLFGVQLLEADVIEPIVIKIRHQIGGQV